jgi:hypothetical protein
MSKRDFHFASLKVTFHDEKPRFRNVGCILDDETPTSPGRDVSGQAETGTPLSVI